MFFHPSLALFITQRDMINSLSVLITWIMCMFIVLCCPPWVTGIDLWAQLWDLCLSCLPGFSTYMIHTFCILKTRVLSIELFINELSTWTLLGVTGSRTDNESCWIFMTGYAVLLMPCIHTVFILEKCRPPRKTYEFCVLLMKSQEMEIQVDLSKMVLLCITIYNITVGLWWNLL